MIFFLLLTEIMSDGNKYINDAINNGAKIIVSSVKIQGI